MHCPLRVPARAHLYVNLLFPYETHHPDSFALNILPDRRSVNCERPEAGSDRELCSEDLIAKPLPEAHF
jgi:hypothetical protein